MTFSGAPHLDGRKRPSGWWYALPATLLAAAVASFVVMLVVVLFNQLSAEAEVTVDGTAQTVSLEPERTMTFLVPDAPGATTACTFVDQSTGEEIVPGPAAGSAEKTFGTKAWRQGGSIRTGSGDLEVRCTATGVSPEHTVQFVNMSASGLGFGLVMAYLVPFAFAAAAFVTLIWLLMRGAGSRAPTRPSR